MKNIFDKVGNNKICPDTKENQGHINTRKVFLNFSRKCIQVYSPLNKLTTIFMISHFLPLSRYDLVGVITLLNRRTVYDMSLVYTRDQSISLAFDFDSA